ncbi:MAG: hypothetical protein IGS03_06610 [Candidatus Sericytochromatia bacterium]|nr:hypothetical protein [Candidatus Sericytochromatia bacterium]
MIDPEGIKAKALRRYPDYLKAWVQKEYSFFPLEIPADKKVPEDFGVFQQALQALLQASKTHQGLGYTVELKSLRHQRYGLQQVPCRIVFESEVDFLTCVQKSSEVARFKRDAQLLLQAFPVLHNWICEFPRQVIAHAGDWPEIIDILTYYREHPRPGIYLREVPLPISSKFIEKHTDILNRLLQILCPDALDEGYKDFVQRWGFRSKPGPFFRLRPLDPDLRAQWLGLEELSLSLQQLQSWTAWGKRCLIVENEITYLSLPALPDTVAIWGHGNQARSLCQLPRLQHCKLYYWGDLDTQGLRILAGLRQGFADLQSLWMDSCTLQNYQKLMQPGTPDRLPPPAEGLSQSELALFEQLQTHNWRLEQEHIPHPDILKVFQQLSVSFVAEKNRPGT